MGLFFIRSAQVNPTISISNTSGLISQKNLGRNNLNVKEFIVPNGDTLAKSKMIFFEIFRIK
jgi:hypothetical protein